MEISSEFVAEKNSIIVIGLGPIGLAITLESLKNAKGRKVVAITDRQKEDYTRGQVLRLDEHSITYLKGLIGEKLIETLLSKGTLEKKYIENEKKNFYFIQVKTLEKTLFAALDKYKLEQLEIINLTKESGNNLKINTVEHLLEIKSHNSTLRNFSFKYLIAADGAKHKTTTLLNDELKMRQDPSLKGFFTSYESTQVPQTHAYQAVAIFKLPEGENSTTYSTHVNKKNESNVSLEELRGQGWKLNKKPDATTVILIKNKLYIGADIPKEFAQIEDPALKKQKINEWLKLILKYYLNQEEIEKLTPEHYKEDKKGFLKNKMQATVFEIMLDEANRTLTPLPPKKYQNLDAEILHQRTAYFFSVGDALRKTHYQTATGAITGLREAEAYGKFLADGENLDSLQEYHANVAAAREDSRQGVNKYLEDQARQEEEQTQQQRKSL